MSSISWWKGTRGEWYVIAQIVLVGLVVFGPRTWAGGPAWPFPDTVLIPIGSVGLILMGGALAVAGILRHGSNITALPYPKEQATLIETGPYRLVRHPMYSGAILAAFGWALLSQGWLTIGYALILLVFFDVKSRREEQWLMEKFADHEPYQRRVRKLIPFVY